MRCKRSKLFRWSAKVNARVLYFHYEAVNTKGFAKALNTGIFLAFNSLFNNDQQHIESLHANC